MGAMVGAAVGVGVCAVMMAIGSFQAEPRAGQQRLAGR
jgi:hypothetical protein